jgi:transglutaminase-like putative cysteine protease
MKRYLAFCFLVVGLTLGLASRASHSFAGTSVAPHERGFTFSYVVHVPALPKGSQQMRLWIPVPQSSAYQKISNLRIESPVSHRTERESEYGNEYAYFEIPASAAKAPFDIRLTFNVQRLEHIVSLNPAADPPGSNAAPRAELVRFLQPDRLVPTNGVIADLSREQTEGAKDQLAKARKIYDFVEATMRYDKSGEGWGRGDAVWACDSHHGNCTDFHSVFIGMARAAGIPSRFEIGFPLPANQHEGNIPGYHCWAHFYIDGIGWVPVDASEGWKNPAKRDYFFGALDENRVMFTIGRDVRLNPPQKGDPLNYSIYPYAEVDGKAFTGLKNEFSFREIGTAAD